MKAAHLSNFDFDDPSSRNIPFFNKAWEWYRNHILKQRSIALPDERGESELGLQTRSSRSVAGPPLNLQRAA